MQTGQLLLDRTFSVYYTGLGMVQKMSQLVFLTQNLN